MRIRLDFSSFLALFQKIVLIFRIIFNNPTLSIFMLAAVFF